MWGLPTSWFWPYYGWYFEKLDKDVWDQWLTALLTDPFIQTTEILGLIFGIIIIIKFKLYYLNRLKTFFKFGKINIVTKK
jgi:hypothetical protein